MNPDAPSDCHLVNALPIYLIVFAEGNSIFNGFPGTYVYRSGRARASIKLLHRRHIHWNRTVVLFNQGDLIIRPVSVSCHYHILSSVVDQIDASDNRLVLSPYCLGRADLQLKLPEVGCDGLLNLRRLYCPLSRTITTDEHQYAN